MMNGNGARARILSVEPILCGKYYDLARDHGRWPYQCAVLTNRGTMRITYAVDARPHMRDHIAYDEACTYADQIKRTGAPQVSKYNATLLFQ